MEQPFSSMRPKYSDPGKTGKFSTIIRDKLDKTKLKRALKAVR